MIEYAPISDNKMSYEEAVLYCRFCNAGGYQDWRLPTKTEYVHAGLLLCWINNPVYSIGYHYVTPVRDIKIS
jgi:hypothetical protein